MSYPDIGFVHFAILLSALLVGALGFFIYFKLKDARGKYFLVFTFTVAVWCVLKVITLAGAFKLDYIFFVFSLLYLAAFLTSVAFYLFASAYYYGRPTKFAKWFSLVVSLLAGYAIFSPGFFIKGISFAIGSLPEIEYSKLGSFVYAFLFFTTYLSGYSLLIKKYLNTKDKTEKFQTAYIIFATSIPPVIGLITNLILPMFFNIFALQWMAQISVSLAVLIVAYGITKYNLFEFRMVLSEIFVISFWILALTQFAFMQDRLHFFINLVYFALSLVFGYMILSSTRNELNHKHELELATKRLKKINKELVEIDKEKSEFLSIATHQLRTPVASIKGYASMLLEGEYGKLPKKVEEIIKRIYKSSIFMAETITDFLDVSRIELGTVKYQKEEIKCQEFLKEIIQEIYPKFKNLPIELKIEKCKERCKPIVLGDRRFLRHVFINIIENAIKYTPQGYIKISAEYNKTKDKVIFKIKDSGIGIDKKDLPNIFKKFSRAKNAIKHKISGSGLGLYVAKKIIKDHGGKIYARSEGIGKGSEFIIELPVYKKYCTNTC